MAKDNRITALYELLSRDDGYYRKLEDKQTLYVDEVAASVVRRIFQLACEGMELGHTILGKTARDSFKTKRKRVVNEDE